MINSDNYPYSLMSSTCKQLYLCAHVRYASGGSSFLYNDSLLLICFVLLSLFSPAILQLLNPFNTNYSTLLHSVKSFSPTITSIKNNISTPDSPLPSRIAPGHPLLRLQSYPYPRKSMSQPIEPAVRAKHDCPGIPLFWTDYWK